MIQENGMPATPVQHFVPQPLPLDRIICGDNCEVMRTLPDACIDLVVTSPPYDNLRTYSAGKSMSDLWDFEGVAQQLWRVIKPGGVVVWVVNDATVDGSETGTSFRQALRFMEIGFRLHDTMIWLKDGGGAIGSNLCYTQNYEFMFVLSKGQPNAVNLIRDRKNFSAGQDKSGVGRRNADGSHKIEKRKLCAEYTKRNNWWPDNQVSTSNHPAPFPESLARDHILSWSNEGDIVLDPFSGSGTTAKMAKHNGRRFIGIEVNHEYVEISQQRLAQGVLF